MPFDPIYDPAKLVDPRLLSHDPFPIGAPCGIVVHYTADRDLARTRRSLEQRGLGYHLIIGRGGEIEQHAFLDHQVWHAGNALWNGHSPNVKFLAVALASWGELKHNGKVFETWTGLTIPTEEIAYRPSNLKPDARFHWDAATPEQMSALTLFCLWAIEAGIPIDNICGHDECAIPTGRKPDPGGVLPMTMAEYRKFLAVDASKVIA